ncbi:MAG: hypothetical protein RIQ57_45 [Pseudomonadota bacterium]
MLYLVKTFIAVAIILIASELSKKSTTLAAMLLAMPIVLFVSFAFIYQQKKDSAQIAALTFETVIYILPVLPFLFLLSLLLKNGFNFYLSLFLVSIGICIVTYLLNLYLSK